MQSRDTTKSAACASALEKIDVVLKVAEDLEYLLHKTSCLAEIGESTSNRIFFRSSGGDNSNDKPGFYYVGETEKKVLGFLASEVNVLTNGAEASADRLIDGLNDVRDMLKRHQPRDKPALSLKSELDVKIDAWQIAYEAWLATDKRDGSDLQRDIPEARLEQEALEALVKQPCASLGEVRRKATLFSNSEYLQEQASDFTLDLLQSFADVGEE